MGGMGNSFVVFTLYHVVLFAIFLNNEYVSYSNFLKRWRLCHKFPVLPTEFQVKLTTGSWQKISQRHFHARLSICLLAVGFATMGRVGQGKVCLSWGSSWHLTHGPAMWVVQLVSCAVGAQYGGRCCWEKWWGFARAALPGCLANSRLQNVYKPLKEIPFFKIKLSRDFVCNRESWYYRTFF